MPSLFDWIGIGTTLVSMSPVKGNEQVQNTVLPITTTYRVFFRSIWGNVKIFSHFQMGKLFEGFKILCTY